MRGVAYNVDSYNVSLQESNFKPSDLLIPPDIIISPTKILSSAQVLAPRSPGDRLLSGPEGLSPNPALSERGHVYATAPN